MLKKQTTLLFTLAVTLLLLAAFAYQGAAQTKAAKEGRWEGRVEAIDKAGSSLTVRKAGGTQEKKCVYDSSTKWVSQYHADKKVNNIDAGDVKEQDYVICRGTAENAGQIHATLISKRLSHSSAK